MATTDTNPNRDIRLNKDQIDKILKALGQHRDAVSQQRDGTSAYELMAMFRDAQDGDSDGIYDFTA